MDILEFHKKVSSAYLIVQKFNLLELQMNYLRYPMIFGSHKVLRFYFVTDLKLSVLDFQQIHFLWMIPSQKLKNYGIIGHLTEIINPKYQFFLRVTKF